MCAVKEIDRPCRGNVTGTGDRAVEAGITALGDGTFIATLDNGFGTKQNSKDAVLAFVRLTFRWETNTVEVLDESFGPEYR